VRFVDRAWPVAAAIVTGLLLAGCFAPWNQEWFCWFALAPLLSAIWFRRVANERFRWRGDLLLGYLAGFVYFAAAFHWLGALGRLMQTPLLFTLPLLLGLYMGLYPAFWAWFVGMTTRALGRRYAARHGSSQFLRSRQNLAIAFLAAAAWVTHEWVRGVLFTGWGWNGLGVALHRNLALIQIAEFTGVAGISFLVVIANVIAVLTVRRFVLEATLRKLRPHFDFTIMMLLIVGTFSFGIHRLFQNPDGRTLTVAAVQANIPQEQKWNAAADAQTVETYRALTELALASRPELVIWPEAATPSDLFDPATVAYIQSLGGAEDLNLLFGSILSEQGNYNVAALLQRSSGDLQIYRKIHLVPFGEFIPFRKTFPLFAMIAGSMVPGDFDRGMDFTPLTLRAPEVKIAALICFEDSLGDLARRPVQRGAELLVNITNDGWFLESAGAEQHFANAVFRTIENRRPMVRSANTGVTCFVDAWGRTKQVLRAEDGRPFVQGVLSGKVTIPEPLRATFFTQFGELFSYGAIVVTMATLVWLWIARVRVERAG
jgi:apolipoprotein N-acyltransferase